MHNIPVYLSSLAVLCCAVCLCVCGKSVFIPHFCYLFVFVNSLPPAVRRVPPRFTIPPTSHEIMPGGSVNITCVAVGSPMPYVKWMQNSEDLTPEDSMPVGRNVLELESVRESANYTCVAISSLGMIEAVAQVIVKCKFLTNAAYRPEP